jgi:adenylate cyclase
MADPILFELNYHLAAPVERVWPILADTDRLNRQIGLPPARREAIGSGPVNRGRVRARLKGLALEFEEEPFRYVEGDHYWVRRRITRGPLREFNGGIRFVSTPTGTEVQVRSEFVPANAVGRALVRALCEKTRRDFDGAIAGIRAHLAEERPNAYGEGVDIAPPASRAATLERLRAADPALLREPLAGRLTEHLASGGEAELARIRPFALARRWGVERWEALRLCLQATRAGVLDMSWDLLCPNCRGPENRWSSLSQVQERGHCESCRISYDANFDRAVEVPAQPPLPSDR